MRLGTVQPQRSNMNVSERYGRDLGPPQHVLDATQGLLEHRLANKLWSSADDDRRRADVLVDGSNDRAARVARIGLWRSQDVLPGMSPAVCARPLRRTGPKNLDDQTPVDLEPCGTPLRPIHRHSR